MVWHSHLFKSFLQFVMIHTSTKTRGFHTQLDGGPADTRLGEVS